MRRSVTPAPLTRHHRPRFVPSSVRNGMWVSVRYRRLPNASGALSVCEIVSGAPVRCHVAPPLLKFSPAELKIGEFGSARGRFWRTFASGGSLEVGYGIRMEASLPACFRPSCHSRSACGEIPMIPSSAPSEDSSGDQTEKNRACREYLFRSKTGSEHV